MCVTSLWFLASVSTSLNPLALTVVHRVRASSGANFSFSNSFPNASNIPTSRDAHSQRLFSKKATEESRAPSRDQYFSVP